MHIQAQKIRPTCQTVVGAKNPPFQGLRKKKGNKPTLGEKHQRQALFFKRFQQTKDKNILLNQTVKDKTGISGYLRPQ